MATSDKDTLLDDEQTPAVSTAAVDLDLDVQDDKRKKLPPFTVRLGGKTWTIEPPDGGLVMELEEVRTTRGALALIFDDQWSEAGPLCDRLDPPDLTKLVRQYARHFEIDMEAMQVRSAPNRSERRRLRRKS